MKLIPPRDFAPIATLTTRHGGTSCHVDVQGNRRVQVLTHSPEAGREQSASVIGNADLQHLRDAIEGTRAQALAASREAWFTDEGVPTATVSVRLSAGLGMPPDAAFSIYQRAQQPHDITTILRGGAGKARNARTIVDILSQFSPLDVPGIPARDQFQPRGPADAPPVLGSDLQESSEYLGATRRGESVQPGVMVIRDKVTWNGKIAGALGHGRAAKASIGSVLWDLANRMGQEQLLLRHGKGLEKRLASSNWSRLIAAELPRLMKTLRRDEQQIQDLITEYGAERLAELGVKQEPEGRWVLPVLTRGSLTTRQYLDAIDTEHVPGLSREVHSVPLLVPLDKRLSDALVTYGASHQGSNQNLGIFERDGWSFLVAGGNSVDDARLRFSAA